MRVMRTAKSFLRSIGPFVAGQAQLCKVAEIAGLQLHRRNTPVITVQPVS